MEVNVPNSNIDVLNRLVNDIISDFCNEALWEQIYDKIMEVQISLKCEEEIDAEKLIDYIQDQLSLIRLLPTFYKCMKENISFQNWSQVKIVLKLFLQVILSTFQFCQLAGKNLDYQKGHLPQKLSFLFKETYNNLKCTLELLEYFQVTFGNINEEECLQLVLSGLVSISLVLMKFDIMGVVAVWKYMKKLCSSHYGELLQLTLCQDKLFDVCEICKHVVEQCFISINKENLFVKYIKVLRFFFSFLVQLTKDFKNTSKSSCKCIYGFLSDLQSYNLRCCKSIGNENNIYKDFLENLIPLADSVIVEFLTMKDTPIICKNASQSNDTREKEAIAHQEQLTNNILLKCKLLGHVSTLNDEHLASLLSESGYNLFKDIFNEVVENSILFFTCKKACFHYARLITTTKVSIYDYVLAYLCIFCCNMSQRCLQLIESSLLSFVLSTSWYAYMMATDVWCFILSIGPAQLCMDHIQFVATLILSSRKNKYKAETIEKLLQLLKRFFILLPMEYYNVFISIFPVREETLEIWSLVPIHKFRATDTQIVCSGIMSTALSLLLAQERDEILNYQIVSGLECLSSIFQHEHLYQNVPEQLKCDIYEQMLKFWMCLYQFEEDIQMSEDLTIAMLGLTSVMFLMVEAENVEKVLSVIKDVLNCTDSTAFHIAVAKFLASLKRVRFPSAIESVCLSCIVGMFQQLLNTEQWIVDVVTMTALKEYAEVTPYPQMLSVCLPAHRKSDFTMFLKRIPSDISHFNETTSSLLYEEILTVGSQANVNHKSFSKASIVSSNLNLNADGLTNSLKDKQSVEAVLVALENGVKELQTLSEHSQLRIQSLERIKTLATTLMDIGRN